MLEENINNFIIDASFILSFLIPDEITDPLAKDLLPKYKRGEVSFLSTNLFPFEVLNSMRMVLVKKRILPNKVPKLVEIFLLLNIPLEEIDFRKTFSFAVQENLTVYDASYVVLAREKKIPLLMLDTRLKKVAEKELLINYLQMYSF